MAIRTVVADDEPLALSHISRWVSRDNRLRLVGKAATGVDALHQIENKQADLAFLDIHMPGISGVEVLRSLRARKLDPFVVFVTANEQYAVDAFSLQAGDYLVKPMQKRRFSQSIERAVKAIQQRLQISSLDNAHEPILFREGERTTLVTPDQILWVEAASQYSRVHTADKSLFLSRPLASVESVLPMNLFLRVHRSALVNIGHIQRLVTSSGKHFVELTGGLRVSIARARRKEILSQLKAHGKRA